MSRRWVDVKRAIEDLRQRALTHHLGQIACDDGHHEHTLPCPHCGAAL